ncbi:hypothetical protein B296_00021101 [Ensete ventricosum]|uniref:GDP-D-glucose phosphorylase 1 n=1 Tax=Ensete ventricosum TaxID=4639 RepID=A0A427B0D2_ENSVE|nr:hypothetical protein B296_00021101 [Ensete ventricosum]
MNRGLFRYDVTACETKVIPGDHGFIAQLNEGRHLKKRPTEFRVDRVLQAFDPAKFNFTKVGQEEVLFRFEAAGGEKTCLFEHAGNEGTKSPSVVAINVRSCYAEKQALGEVSQELLDTQVNPAVWEISGHMVLKRKKDYEEASEAYAWRLLAEVSLSEERFHEVKTYIFEAIGLVDSEEETIDEDEEKGTPSNSSDPTHAPHFPEGCLILQ